MCFVIFLHIKLYFFWISFVSYFSNSKFCLDHVFELVAWRLARGELGRGLDRGVKTGLAQAARFNNSKNKIKYKIQSFVKEETEFCIDFWRNLGVQVFKGKLCSLQKCMPSSHPLIELY